MKQGRFLFILIFSLIIPTNVFAVSQNITKPNFPSCRTPQGELKVYYPEGVHGIPGNSSVFTGKDWVYILSEDTLTQCFCALDSSGIQTNWWKVSSLTIDEIDMLTSEGWIYVADGSLWGLDRAPYMAKNINYSCADDKKDDKDEEDKNDKHDGPDEDDDEEEQEGDILGFAFGRGGPAVLAATGNLFEIAAYSALGTMSLAAFIAVLKRHKANE